VKLVSGARATEKFVLEAEAGSLVVVRSHLQAQRCSWTAAQSAPRPWPKPFHLPPGKHVLSLRAADYEDA